VSEVLCVDQLRKFYGKKFPALTGVSFKVQANEIFALIGPNGAGKTTTLRVIATILTPTSGQITVLGQRLDREADKIREHISYLPEEAGAYKNLTGLNYLKFMAELYTADRSKQRAYVETATEIFGLKDRLKEKIGTYSKGMTRKILLARTMMTEPKLAILDEPTSGLDVLNAMEIRELIKKKAETGMAVLLSSHNMLEIEHLSHRVAVMDHGIIHEIGTPAGLKEKYGAKNLEEVFAEVVKCGNSMCY